VAEEQLAKDVAASTPSCAAHCDALWQAAKEWAASKRAGNLFIEPNQIRVNTNIAGNLMALTINPVTENGVNLSQNRKRVRHACKLVRQ
jgi:hypothetical protein